MTITRVESVTFGVESIEEACRFWDDWGLQCLDRGAQGANFGLPTGQSVHVRGTADAGLPPPVEDAYSTAREIVWGVDSEPSLKALAVELQKDREVRSGADGVLRTTDPCGIAIGFRVARPRAAPARAEGTPELNYRIAHVVYSVMKHAAPEMSAFYLDRLGFRLSDRVRDNGDFMRAPGADDHHNFFLQHRPDRLAFNHVAFELDNFEDVLEAGKHMESRGWKTVLGPGGHYLSSHKFWYFKSPCGGDAEYFFGATRFNDTWQTRFWDTAPRTGPSGA